MKHRSLIQMTAMLLGLAVHSAAHAQTLFGPEIAVESANAEVGISSDGFLTLTYFQDKASTGLLYYLQASPSLLSWMTPNATTTSTEDAGDFWRITLRDTVPVSEADRRFLRLKIMESAGISTLLFPPTTLGGHWVWDGKILRASLSWSDNSPIETAYAIERDLGTGFQSVATTAPDTAHYLDPRATPTNSTATYRVRAIAPGEASAYTNELTLTTPTDTDLDGIPDQYELGELYIGDHGTYATSAFNFSSGSSGISDGWLIRYGLDPFTADPDAMMPGGMTLQEKYDEGLDPTVEDTDLDGVIDSEDAVAYEPLFTHSRLPLASYAIIGLGEVEQEGEPVLLSDNGLVILRKESENADTTYRFWKAGTGGEIAIPEEMRATWSDSSFVMGFFGINASDVATGTMAQDYSEEPPFSFPGWGWAAFTWTIEEGFRLLPLPQEKPGWPGEFLVYSLQRAFRIDDSGVVRGESYYQYQAPPPPDASPSAIWDINYQGFVQWAVGGATFTDSPDIDPTLVQDMEYIPGVHREAMARSGGGIEAWVDGIYPTTTSHIENFALGPVGENWVGSINDLPKPFAVGEHLTPNPLGAYPAMSAWVRQDQQWSRVDLLAAPPASDGSTIRLEAEDQLLRIATQLKFSPERPSGPVLTNDLGQVVLAWSRLEGSPGGWENARSHLWQNGRAHEISTLLPSGWSDVEVTGLNDTGAMIAVARKTTDAQGQPIPEADQKKHGLLLLPVEFVTKGKNDAEISTTVVTAATRGPTVELDHLAVANVTVVGGEGRVTVRGTIRDAIADNVPQGQGADIAHAKIYVNGEQVDDELALTRENDGAPDAWRRYPVKWTFERQVTFPTEGTAKITVESGSNVAGLIGSDDMQIHFARTHTGSVNVPAQTHDYEIVLLGSFSPTVADTVTLRQPSQPVTGQLLQETGPSTGIFQRSDGLFLVFSGDYQSSGEVDKIYCKIVPASGFAGLGYGSSVECVESGQTSNTFRYTENVPGYGYGDTFSQAVSGVTNVDDEPAADRPLKLRLGIPESWQDIFTVDLAGQTLKAEFADAATGMRYASTHAQEPWIAHAIVDPADAEALKLIYWDKTANTLRQVPLDDLEEDLKAKLSLNQNELAEVPLKATRLGWVNASGDDVAGLQKLTVEALVGLIAGDSDMEIDDEHFAYIEVTGMTEDRRLRVSSSDFPSDKFELVIGDAAASGRSAQLEEIAEGHYRTTEKVIVYQSSPDTDTLTDAQWNALKEMGYLAVHNQEPFTVDMQGGKNINEFKYPDHQDHHIFNKFRDSSPRYQNFFKKVFGSDFEVDRYTIPLEKKRHRQTYNQVGLPPNFEPLTMRGLVQFRVGLRLRVELPCGGWSVAEAAARRLCAYSAGV